MTDLFCGPCEKTGVLRKAHRIVGSVPMCNDHFLKSSQVSAQVAHAPIRKVESTEVDTPRYALMLKKESESKAVPATPAKEEETVPLRKEFDRDAMQRDRDSGMRITDVAKKYDVHVSSVYMNTKAATKLERLGRGGPKLGKPAKTSGVHGTPAGEAINQLLPELRARRDKLNALIEQLEQLESI
jgi:transposase